MSEEDFYQDGVEMGLGLARSILQRLGGKLFFERAAAGAIGCTIILPEQTATRQRARHTTTRRGIPPPRTTTRNEVCVQRLD